jgi:uncharacterized membrane protein
MPPFIAGLPLHPLVVHAVVVLVPLAVLATIIVAVWSAARARYGWLAVGVTAAATATIPIALGSGDELRARLPDNALIAQHADLGDQLLILVAPLFVVVTALMFVHRARTHVKRTEGPGATIAARPARWVRPTAITLSVLTVALAVGSAVQVVRIGDSGARAAWSDTQYIQPTHGG